MKLVISLPEIRATLAEKHGLMTNDVQVTHGNGSPVVEPAYVPFGVSSSVAGYLGSPQHLQNSREAMDKLFYIFRSASVNCHTVSLHDKIAAIKAVRALTGLALKDAKDLVESLSVPF